MELEGPSPKEITETPKEITETPKQNEGKEKIIGISDIEKIDKGITDSILEIEKIYNKYFSEKNQNNNLESKIELEKEINKVKTKIHNVKMELMFLIDTYKKNNPKYNKYKFDNLYNLNINPFIINPNEGLNYIVGNLDEIQKFNANFDIIKSRLNLAKNLLMNTLIKFMELT